MTVDPVGATRIVAREVSHRDSVVLLRGFCQEQLDRYGFAKSIGLDADVYRPPNGSFLVMYAGDEAVGRGTCRGYRNRTSTTETRKAYLTEAARARGLGQRLLDRLEGQAAGRTIPETGVRNTAAHFLFAGIEYTPISRYVTGREPGINRAAGRPSAQSPRASVETGADAVAP